MLGNPRRARDSTHAAPQRHAPSAATVVAAALIASCVPKSESGGASPVVTVATRADDAAPVARTERFVFYSRFEFNLHDRLLHWANDEDRLARGCIDGLEPQVRANWEEAVRAFEPLRTPGSERLALRLRYALVAPEDAEIRENLGAVPPWYRTAFDDASAAYRRCFWADDDRRNREWIRALVARVHRVEDTMAKRIELAHGIALENSPIPVDVVPVVNFGGAETVVHPHHILISSTQPGYDGFGGLELIFHEASHTVVSPRSDGSIAALRQAAEQEGVELPRDLWHAVLFFTAGHATQKTVREVWGDDYEPYMYSQGLFTRAWPRWREPFERWWRPYLDGAIPLEEAARGLVAEARSPR
jgi:hypothetical protein